MLKFTCCNEIETKSLGIRFAQLLEGGSFVCLDGDLGAGKTFFSQAVIQALGVTDYVTSPSYTIVNEYGHIYHFDVYRIDDIDEMYEIGYEEYFFSDGICLVEWASMIEELIPKSHYRVVIQMGDTINSRIISISGSTEELNNRLEQLK